MIQKTSENYLSIPCTLEVDMEESFKWYKMAADRGHVMAQNNLGALYYLGQGVPWMM
jgi:TPR repeat protein